MPHATEIVSIGMEETELGVTIPFTWANVRSWRPGGGTERILLRPDERVRLWGGQAVVVLVRRGFYGVMSVSSIEPDVEKHSRDVLAVFPDAAQARKELAVFYFRLSRYADAALAAREYARRFPNDLDFPAAIANLLISRDRFADVVTTLDEVAPRRPNVDVYALYGYALGMQGLRRQEALSYLHRARAMQPTYWWPHYALGWVYAAGGEYGRAVESFEKVTALRPGLYDVERELDRIRPLVAQAPAR